MLVTVRTVAKMAALLAFAGVSDGFAFGPSFGRPSLAGRATAPLAASSQRGPASALLGTKMAISSDESGGMTGEAIEKAERNLDHVFKNNKLWVIEQTKNDPEFFARMSTGQAPKFLWIGCSDARVPANEIVGCGPGELFVHRNIANLVVNNDNSIQSVFQYAVEYLQVEHIIVCGHYQCGGVLASMNNNDLASPLEEWVRNIRDVYRLHKEEIDSITDVTQRQRRMVELNAQEQALNVYKQAVVQRRRVYTHLREGFATPRVHAVVFDIETGELKNLDWEKNASLGKFASEFDATNAPLGEKEKKMLEASVAGAYPKRPNTPSTTATLNRAVYNRMPAGLQLRKSEVDKE